MSRVLRLAAASLPIFAAAALAPAAHAGQGAAIDLSRGADGPRATVLHVVDTAGGRRIVRRSLPLAMAPSRDCRRRTARVPAGELTNTGVDLAWSAVTVRLRRASCSTPWLAGPAVRLAVAAWQQPDPPVPHGLDRRCSLGSMVLEPFALASGHRVGRVTVRAWTRAGSQGCF